MLNYSLIQIVYRLDGQGCLPGREMCIVSASLPIICLVGNEAFLRIRSGWSMKLTVDLRLSADVTNAWSFTFMNFPCLRGIAIYLQHSN